MEGGNDPMTMLAGRGSRFNNQSQNSQYPPQNSQYPPNTSQSKKNQGHTKETCYRILCFPTDFKSKRRVSTDEDSIPHAHVSTAEAASSTSGGGTAVASGSDLLTSIFHMMVSQPTGSCKANAITGMNVKHDNVNVENLKWIIDSGATHHVTYYDKILHDYKQLTESNPNKVQVPTGNKIQIDHIGNAVILKNISWKMCYMISSRSSSYKQQNDRFEVVASQIGASLYESNEAHFHFKE
ncbi:hypothetical protein H5410_013029 [Solanum commersonii]|uniref:Retrovirus-related Pol polyprotein from transposon TNT 1-94-like beta-barrel domain-containing protein n=1 Tax=Solanum commersonii TaxID=4109 RepID=A0A9J6AU56_SOLCO|nr:hypothetical protein H5410_013029 [Solanum commersonii]